MHVVYAVASALEAGVATTTTALGEPVAIDRKERKNREEAQADEYSDHCRSFLISLPYASHTIQFVTELALSDIAVFVGNDAPALRFQAALL